VTGCDKFADEKQIVKFLRKMLASELDDKKELPFKAVAKKEEIRLLSFSLETLNNARGSLNYLQLLSCLKNE